MPGLAIDSSENGWSLSTTTARFIGTASGVLPVPETMRSVSAATGRDTTVANATPSAQAPKKLFIFMVILPLRSRCCRRICARYAVIFTCLAQTMPEC